MTARVKSIPTRLAASSLQLTTDPAACPDADVYIVTVPTPVDREQ